MLDVIDAVDHGAAIDHHGRSLGEPILTGEGLDLGPFCRRERSASLRFSKRVLAIALARSGSAGEAGRHRLDLLREHVDVIDGARAGSAATRWSPTTKTSIRS